MGFNFENSPDGWIGSAVAGHDCYDYEYLQPSSGAGGWDNDYALME